MNRQQAEHILDAYVRMRMRESDKDASDAMREVILDAMTEYKTETYGGLVYHPGGTVTIPTRYTHVGTGDPNMVKPSVTTVESTAEIVGYKDGIVKVRTIEDLLESFIEDYDNWDEFAHFGRDQSRNALFARYADEIRKAVG